jgi:hypothetical protein
MSRILAPTSTRGVAPSHAPPDMRYNPGAGLAQFLGWFSIALGLTEIVACRPLARCLGVRKQTWMFPLLGLREMLTGIGILSKDRAPHWLWGRVAGDIMDLTLLGGALASPRPRPGNVAGAVAAVLGVSLLDALCATQQTVAATLEG